MTHEEKLPWELTEEILSRIPPKSLGRFRTVSKQWNDLFEDEIFIHNHKTTFQFILTTNSKIYSVSIIPKVEVRELTLDIPGLESEALVNNLVDCNEFLLCGMNKGSVVWNPWLRQTRWINQPSVQFNGMCYVYGNNTLEESSYKILASSCREGSNIICWKIHDFASDSWKDIELEHGGGTTSSSNKEQEHIRLSTNRGVSLNGNLYWVAYFVQTSLYVLVYFDFSTEKLVKLCDLPCEEKYHHNDAVALRVFRGYRFSLLKQYCHLTKKIVVWVTKNKINKRCEQGMLWMIFMEVSIPNLPALVHIEYTQPSYFINDKELVVCFCDEIGRAWIYVMGNNKLISKTHIASVVDPWPLHCTYFPSLVPIPRGQREEEELQV